MPVPENQRKRLKEELDDHRKRNKALKRKIEAAQTEEQIHDSIVSLGSEDKLLLALDELHDDPERAEQISGDPIAYFKEKGVKIPREAKKVTVTKGGGNKVRVVAHMEQRNRKFKLIWDRDEGFSVGSDQ